MYKSLIINRLVRDWDRENMRNWEKKALELLEKSLTGIPHELNELDWKENLSSNHEKLSKNILLLKKNMAQNGRL